MHAQHKQNHILTLGSVALGYPQSRQLLQHQHQHQRRHQRQLWQRRRLNRPVVVVCPGHASSFAAVAVRSDSALGQCQPTLPSGHQSLAAVRGGWGLQGQRVKVVGLALALQTKRNHNQLTARW